MTETWPVHVNSNLLWPFDFRLGFLYYLVAQSGEIRKLNIKQRRKLDDARRDPTIVIFKEMTLPPTITYQLKVVVSFLQIATSLVLIAEVPFPALYQTVIGYLAFVNLDFIPWQVRGCEFVC